MKLNFLKLFNLLLVVVIIFTLTSCGSNENDLASELEDVAKEDEVGENTSEPVQESDATQDEQPTVDTQNEIALVTEFLDLIDHTNLEVKSIYGDEGSMLLYWGGTPAVFYDILGSGFYLTVLFDHNSATNVEDVFLNNDSSDEINYWPDEYEIDAVVLSGISSSLLFDNYDILTYDDLKENIDNFPDLLITPPDDPMFPNIPYLTYGVGDKKVELEFEEVNGEYILVTALVADIESSLNTLLLRM